MAEWIGDSLNDDVRERDGSSTLEDVRDSTDWGDRPPEGVFISIKSGSSTNSPESILLVSSMGFDFSMEGDCVGVLLRPDILLMISMLLFFMTPAFVGPLVGSGGNPQICRATLNSILSLRRNAAFG